MRSSAALGVGGADVDDVAQETFLVAYRKLDEWDRGRDAGPWLRGIARHLAANERRKAARRSRLIAGRLGELLVEHAEPEAATPAAELLDALNACLQELPETSRELLRRRYADGELRREPGRATADAPTRCDRNCSACACW